MCDSIPADRVSAPDPLSLFEQPVRPAMVKVRSWTIHLHPERSIDSSQPGAGKGFLPMNTLNGFNNAPRPTKPTVYGKSSRHYDPRISQARGTGEVAYLGRSHANSPTTPARDVSSRQERPYRSGASHSKRRKTGHPSPQAIIDFTEDDEVQEVPLSHSLATPAVHEYEVPRSSHSSRSRHSAESGPTLSGRQPKVQAMSQFKFIDNITKGSRGRRKQQTSGSKSPFGRSVSGSATPNTQGTPIQIHDDEPVASFRPTGNPIFDGFEQGVSDRVSKESNGHNKRAVTTSHHFPNARINESTADAKEQTATARRANGPGGNLRNFKPAQKDMHEADPISDDELAMEMPKKKTTATKRQASPSKTSQAANSSAKRKVKAGKTSHSWPLIFARSHDFESHCPVSREADAPSLKLESGDESNTWRVVEYDAPNPSGTIKALITPKDVIKVQADDEGRMRLEGSRQQDGNHPIFDLDFYSPRNFREFRDMHVPLLSPRQVVQRESELLDLLLKRPLHKNGKVGTSTLVNEASISQDEQAAPRAWTSKTPLRDQLIPRTQNAEFKAVLSGNKDSATTIQSSSRTARSTRSSAPVHDVEDIYEEAPVEKFSIQHGLGPPWHAPLTYGTGRQKAVVDFADLPRLDEEEMLNDSLIDFYMIWLSDQYEVPKDKVYFFNTYFYTKLTEKTGRASMNHKAVERWTSKVDIFTYDYIVVPINEATHWYLAIICNVGNIVRKPIQEDFGDDAVEDPTIVDPTKAAADQSASGAADPLSVTVPDDSATTIEDTQGEGDDDPNLFEEDSINLINRDDTGPDHEQGDVTHDSSTPHSPGESAQAADAALPAFDQPTAPVTVLSNLSAPSEKKKKTKRKAPVVKRDPSQPVIIVLDSLAGAHSNAVRALKDWLAAEGQARRGMEAVIKENGVYPKGDQIPTQNNFSDCGVYVLGYIEKFFKDPDEFKTKLLTGDMTAEADWPDMNPADLRHNLRDILLGLAESQSLAVPKRKKGKKTSTVANKALTSPRAQTANAVPEVSVPQTATTGLVDNEAEPPTTTAPEAEPVVTETRPQDEPPQPRLMSPIKLQPRAEAPVSDAEFMGDKSPEIVVGKVSDSPPISTSPLKRTSMSPQKQTPGKRTLAAVRIPVKSPLSQQLSRKGHHVEVTSTSINESPTKTVARDTRSTSPLKRKTHATEDGDELCTPATKKRAKLTSPEKGRRSSRTSPTLGVQRDGSSDYPIEIQDSQDVKSKASQSPGGFRTGSPAQRKPPSRSSHPTQSLRHAPSVEEIPPPPPRESPRKRRQADEDDVGHQLEVRLDADDQAREEASLVASQMAPSASLERAEEYEPDDMEIDSQGGCPMDTADDTIADGTVRETPEAARRSPSWSFGQTLPL